MNLIEGSFSYDHSNVVVLGDDDVDPNACVVIGIVRGDVDQCQVEPPLEAA